MVGLIAANIATQREKAAIPKIRLKKFSVEQRKRIKLDHEKQYRFYRAVYIEVYNKGEVFKIAERVFPHVVWYDENGILLTQNNGRWWRSFPHKQIVTTELQLWDLEPSGQEKRLYFAIKGMKQNGFNVWFRTQDNKEPVLTYNGKRYFIGITFKSNNGSSAHFEFELVNTAKTLRLRKRSKWIRTARRLASLPNRLGLRT
jgi:hypothetical protein